MSTAVITAAGRPAFLPDDGPVGTVCIDGTWSAVTVPARWGHHVVDVLGDCTGPVFHDPGLRHLAWIVPPGGGADWPDASAAGVRVHGSGDVLFVPGPEGYYDGTRWLRPPTDATALTDPAALRAAVEFIIGPLAEAAQLGPVHVCWYCRTVTRDGLVIDWYTSPSGPGAVRHSCRRCWARTVRGEDAPHLRAVREGPR